MAQDKTIAVVTGTRAEFGLLQPVMGAIRDHPRLTLVSVVGGVHLVAPTAGDIEKAGFTIDATAPMQRHGQVGRWADTAALGRGIGALGDIFAQWRPDLVLVLGDRIEAFAAACSASVGGIRVGHLHGGDRAQGVADEAMRHAISKLAHLHFPATAASRQRLIHMGEAPEQVHHLGSPAMDALAHVKPDDHAPDLIVLQHPVGDSDEIEAARMDTLLKATSSYSRLVLGPNHDPGRAGIMRALEGCSVTVTDHLPRGRFLDMLAGAKAIVGNSSAGLIEAAALKTACVNFGNRQGGREKPANVVDCASDTSVETLAQRIRDGLGLDLRDLDHPYGDGRTGRRIAHLLAHLNLEDVPLSKRNRY